MATEHHNLIRSLEYLEQVIHLRLQHHMSKKSRSPLPLPAFVFEGEDDLLSQFVAYFEFSIEEFIVLLLALAPHVNACFFENIVGQYLPAGGDMPEFGGTKGTNYRYMLPTIETALFVLAGEDIERRLLLSSIFESDHSFCTQKVLTYERVPWGEPRNSARILIDQEFVELFTTGRVSTPQFGPGFPAELIETEMEWGDLVLEAPTLEALKEIEIWGKHHESIMEEWGMGRKLKPGYRALFYGPPGTGKTLAASLIGKHIGRKVFRVDLSKVISKYIGETEKNLADFLDKAENKNWCIFFDEADACFGKRSQTKEAKDRYANQEVAYLLQRIESYRGLVIMATNFRKNIDRAFIRRFNSIVYFPVPKAPQRLEIWRRALPEGIKLSSAIDLPQLASNYDLTGSNIMNVVQYACLQTKNRASTEISLEVLEQGIKKEYEKEGK